MGWLAVIGIQPLSAALGWDGHYVAVLFYIA